MLNLLKFEKEADYSNFEYLKPADTITGEAAYQLYIKNTLPGLEKVGSQIIYYGKSQNFLIGPAFEQWDAILLVAHKSLLQFMEFAQSKTYLMQVGYRIAALEDSRLLPSLELKDYT